MNPLRIAFLTPAFVTEPNSGGVGSYLHRLTKTLGELGHEVEVFTLSQEQPGSIEFEGIRVERVRPANGLPHRLLQRLAHTSPALDLTDVAGRVRGALGLSRALSRRERARPFKIVQTSDYGLAGLFVRRQPGRLHLVRCSWAADLFIEADGNLDKLDSRLYCLLERHCVRKADLAYAPSEFVARHYRERHGLDLAVVRPPVMVETAVAGRLPWELPRRYFMYFGAICRRKGADVLAAALPLVWRREPEFAMVWAGEAWNGTLDSFRALWGERAAQVRWLGLIPKSELYAVLKGAEVVVLPSRVDNLPNTVIESLLFGVPVIGSRGASIDELVEPGRNGELVPIGDPAALAAVLVSAWRRQMPWAGGRVAPPSVLAQMEPRIAAVNLLRLAGYAPTHD